MHSALTNPHRTIDPREQPQDPRHLQQETDEIGRRIPSVLSHAEKRSRVKTTGVVISSFFLSLPLHWLLLSANDSH